MRPPFFDGHGALRHTAVKGALAASRLTRAVVVATQRGANGMHFSDLSSASPRLVDARLNACQDWQVHAGGML